MSETQEKFVERRADPSDTDVIIRLLQGLTSRLDAHIDDFQSLKTEFEILKPRLEEVVEIVERSKSIIWFVRAIIYVLAPLVTGYLWVKSHIKFLD